MKDCGFAKSWGYYTLRWKNSGFEAQTYLIGSAEASESNVSRAPLCFRDGKEEDKVSDEEEDVGDDESKLEDCTSSSSSSSLSSEMEDMKQEEDEDSELS